MAEFPPMEDYYCPMHPGARYRHPGTCPYCGQELRESTRFAMLRQIISDPAHMVIMAALIAGGMVAAMMVMR